MALDPLSGASKPLPPAYILSSKNPLPFAATFHDGPLLAPFEDSTPASSSSRPTFGRTSSESFAGKIASPYTRDEAMRLSSMRLSDEDRYRDRSSAMVAVGSDEWMERKIAECVDRADGNMNLGQCGLTTLSTKISDLQHLVTLSSRSPYATSTRTIQHSSPHPAQFSPGPSIPIQEENMRISPFSASARTFSRIASAPVTVSSSGKDRSLSTALAHHRVQLGSPISSSSSSARPSSAGLGPPIDFGGFDPPGSPVISSTFTPRSRLHSSVSHAKSPSLAPTSPHASLGHGLPSQSPSNKRTFTRTASGNMMSAQDGRWYGRGQAQVDLTLASNSLKELPSALFQVTNLVTLSLRQNRLRSLPAAVGELKNLTELNVSGNQMTSFPPAILDLSLEQFHYTNNALVSCPPNVDNKSFPSGRLLGDLQVKSDGCPSLRSLCISQLLSTRQPEHLPALLSRMDWEPTPGSKDPHGLQDADSLHTQLPCLREEECHRILACLRTAYRTSSLSRHSVDGIPNPAFSPSTRKALGKTSSSSSIATPTDDASVNPFYTACPSPHHVDVNRPEGSNNNVTRRIYLHEPAEERLEWVKIKGADSLVPIKWQGCQRGCLDFLEQAEEIMEDGFDIVAEGWE